MYWSCDGKMEEMVVRRYGDARYTPYVVCWTAYRSERWADETQLPSAMRSQVVVRSAQLRLIGMDEPTVHCPLPTVHDLAKSKLRLFEPTTSYHRLVLPPPTPQ